MTSLNLASRDLPQMRWVIPCLFFLSGACGLVYQVVWARMLTVVFGATLLAVSTVLSAFMAGWIGKITHIIVSWEGPHRVVDDVFWAGLIGLMGLGFRDFEVAGVPSAQSANWARR